MVRVSSEGQSRNAFWPMPFRKSCRITLTNEGTRRMQNLYYQVDWRKLPTLAEETPYFHAHYRQALPSSRAAAATRSCDIKQEGAARGNGVLRGPGRGGLVRRGRRLLLRGWKSDSRDRRHRHRRTISTTPGAFTSAKAYIAASRSTQGTGPGPRMGPHRFRWHRLDPIPTRWNLSSFEMEHRGWTFHPDWYSFSNPQFGAETDLLSSVAFWYQRGIAQGLSRIQVWKQPHS